jgi:hypothetical protein
MTAAELALIGIDSVEIMTVFSWGFGMIIFGWGAGFGVGAFVAMIRQL